VARKVFKWIGIAFGVLVLWVIVIMITGAVVKSRVPVNLSPSKLVYGMQDSYAVASGTWVLENDEQAFPLQTTQIRCERETKRCTAGTAMVMLGDQMNVDVSFYDIIAWEKSRVVFTDDSPQCVSYVYTIDLVTKVANGVRSKKKDVTTAECATYDKELKLNLQDGFHVAYALQQKATPWYGELAIAPFKLFR
jgi:hypothetical protein